MANEPIVKAAWVSEGTFFAHVGSYQEEEEDVILDADKVIADDWLQVRYRGTSILGMMHRRGTLDDSDIYANLGEVVTGAKHGRENDKERIFFEPIGMGIEDVAVGYRVYREAVGKGLGVRLTLF
jgi:ornithine cyclodeaminase/alanine dehydrogenase-like protein (mu-crystallin family)